MGESIIILSQNPITLLYNCHIILVVITNRYYKATHYVQTARRIDIPLSLIIIVYEVF